jgi:hypothetical protein
MFTNPFPERTAFALDVLGRYICDGLDEAIQSTIGRPDASPFNLIIIGGSTLIAATSLLTNGAGTIRKIQQWTSEKGWPQDVTEER